MAQGIVNHVRAVGAKGIVNQPPAADPALRFRKSVGAKGIVKQPPAADPALRFRKSVLSSARRQ